MTVIVLLVLAWAGLSAILCACVCIAASRFSAGRSPSEANPWAHDESRGLEPGPARVS